MKRLRILGGLLAVSFLAPGCRRDDNSDNNPLGPEITDSKIAGQYALADNDCQESGGTVALDNASAWQFDGSSTHEQTGFRARSTDVTGMTGDAVASTYFGLHVRQTCAKATNGTSKCEDGELLSRPRVLKVCKAGKSYPQTSYEGIGLTSLAHIEAAARFYRTLEGRVASLTRANLFVIPIIETVTQDASNGTTTSRFESDNLAYLADYVGEPAFLVFPKGAASAELGIWKNLNLWEAPWTLAHEFGHHVLRTHTGVTSFKDDSLIQLPETGFPRGKTEVERTAGGSRVVDKDVIWDGMNEGFADLFAFYSRGSQPGQSKGIDCFTHNRDVEEGAFADGQAKVLNQNVLQVFMSTSKASTSRDCGKPSFQDIHIIGAIFAHGVDQLFSARVAASQNSNVSAAKGALLLKWAEKLETVAKRDSLELLDLLAPALDVASANGRLTAAQCSSVRTNFPVYADKLVGAGGQFTCE